MNTRLIYIAIVIVTLLSSCKESSIDTIIPSIPETDKTVTVTLSKIPIGFAGAPVYVFTINSKGEVYAVQGGNAKENEVVKIAPPVGAGSYSIAAFIPEKLYDSAFTKGQYSRVTSLYNHKGDFITMSWENVPNLTSASTSGIKTTIDAILSINGSEDPSTTNFQESEIITLDATVNDNVKSSVTSLTYSLDKTELKSYNSKPYKFQYNSKGVSLGSHMLYVKAVNGLGQIALDSIKVFFSKSTNVAPSVTLTGLVNGASYTRQDILSITASASDPDDGIDKVELKINNIIVGIDKTSPYTFFWDTYDNPVGSVTVEVTAFDKAGLSRSDVVNVTLIAPPNYSPRATFTSPSDGATFKAGVTVSLKVNASDPESDPINRVEFEYRKSTATTDIFLGQDATSPYSFDFDTTGLSPGDYIIFAIVYDAGGNSSYESLRITITN